MNQDLKKAKFFLLHSDYYSGLFRPARLPLAFAARLLCIVPYFSAIHVSRNRSTQRLKRDEF